MPAKTQPQTQAPTPAAVPMTTMHGQAVQIIGFIPIPRDNLRRQVEVSKTLLAYQEGEAKLADVVALMVDVDFKVQAVGRRVTQEDAKKWSAQPSLPLEEKKPADEQGGEVGD